MKEIYRYYSDTEVAVLYTNVKCPYCGAEWQEEDKSECGEAYILLCDEDDGGCGKEFKMHFDAS